ncbi:hypothetical protein DL769_005100 [Monosporascus sp. CRB-8-3]|nr:hypothetical protein DL769_005100 [Monosporascus sp. CRB-8-3]
MRFQSLAVFALLSLAAAAPSEDKTGAKKKRANGTCNGTSCRVGLANYECTVGSCVGEEGGDGAPCNYYIGVNTYCPVDCGGYPQCP